MAAQKQIQRSRQKKWTFRDVSTRKYTHAIHLYPARMHPEIAKTIIVKYANSKSLVLDPFMGSGGVLLESILQGNDAIGVDINPFAVLLSKVKTEPIGQDLNKVLHGVLLRVSRDLKNKKHYPDLIPTDYAVKGWHQPKVLKTMTVLKHHIYKISDQDVADFFKICFALTIRKTSYQRNGSWKLHRIPDEQRRLIRTEPAKVFASICKNNINRMNDFVAAKPSGIAQSILGDSRDLQTSLNNNKVDLVITSPPYGDHSTTVAYGQFSRHPAHWLDMENDLVMNVDRVGLGGRAYDNMDDLGSDTLNKTLNKIHRNDIKMTKGKTPCRDKDAYAFFYDLDKCLDQVSQNMSSKRSYACFVVANRTVRRVVVPTDKILGELAKKYGFKKEFIACRDIPNKLMPSKNAPENTVNKVGNTMTQEAIIVLRY